MQKSMWAPSQSLLSAIGFFVKAIWHGNQAKVLEVELLVHTMDGVAVVPGTRYQVGWSLLILDEVQGHV